MGATAAAAVAAVQPTKEDRDCIIIQIRTATRFGFTKIKINAMFGGIAFKRVPLSLATYIIVIVEILFVVGSFFLQRFQLQSSAWYSPRT